MGTGNSKQIVARGTVRVSEIDIPEQYRGLCVVYQHLSGRVVVHNCPDEGVAALLPANYRRDQTGDVLDISPSTEEVPTDSEEDKLLSSLLTICNAVQTLLNLRTSPSHIWQLAGNISLGDDMNGLSCWWFSRREGAPLPPSTSDCRVGAVMMRWREESGDPHIMEVHMLDVEEEVCLDIYQHVVDSWPVAGYRPIMPSSTTMTANGVVITVESRMRREFTYYIVGKLLRTSYSIISTTRLSNDADLLLLSKERSELGARTRGHLTELRQITFEGDDKLAVYPKSVKIANLIDNLWGGGITVTHTERASILILPGKPWLARSGRKTSSISARNIQCFWLGLLMEMGRQGWRLVTVLENGVNKGPVGTLVYKQSKVISRGTAHLCVTLASDRLVLAGTVSGEVMSRLYKRVETGLEECGDPVRRGHFKTDKLKSSIVVTQIALEFVRSESMQVRSYTAFRVLSAVLGMDDVLTSSPSDTRWNVLPSFHICSDSRGGGGFGITNYNWLFEMESLERAPDQGGAASSSTSNHTQSRPGRRRRRGGNVQPNPSISNTSHNNGSPRLPSYSEVEGPGLPPSYEEAMSETQAN